MLTIGHSYSEKHCVYCGEEQHTIQKTLVITWTALGIGEKDTSFSSSSHAIDGITLEWTYCAMQNFSGTKYFQIGKNTGEIHNTTALPGTIISITLTTEEKAQISPADATITFGSSANPTGDTKTASFASKGDSQIVKPTANTNPTFFKIAQLGKACAYASITITYEVNE